MNKYLQKKIWDNPKILNHESILSGKTELINIEIDVSGECNHKCIFCYTHGKERKDIIKDRTKTINHFFPSDRLFTLVDELHQVGCKSISFTGSGEPLLHKDIFKLIEKIHSYGIEIGLTTNLSKTLTVAQLETLNKLSWIRCSLNASNKVYYNKIHNPSQKNDFDTTIDNLRKLVNLGDVAINISFVICEENKSNIRSIYRLAKKLKVNSLSFRPDVGYKRNDFAYDIKTLSVLKKLKDKNLIIDNGIERLNDVRKIDKDILCHISNFILFINVDGDVFPCCVTPLNKKFSYYNIMDKSFVDFWNSYLRKNHYKELNMRYCPLCHHTANNVLLDGIYKNSCFSNIQRNGFKNNFL